MTTSLTRFSSFASLLLGTVLMCLTACTPRVQSPPEFCAEYPRPGWAAYEKHQSSNDWFQVYQLAPDLYAIAEPFQWQEVINYLIVGKDKALLFDTGNGIGNIKLIVDQLTALPVTALASHSHIDHVGGHWQFDRVLAPQTAFTSRRELGVKNNLVREEVSSAALCKPLPAGVTEAEHHIRPFTPTGRVADGTIIDLGGVTLEVLSIPGHTPDSLALLNRKSGRLFTGDSYYKGPIWLWAPETDLPAYRQSIERLAALVPDLRAIHGAHNEPFSEPGELIKLKMGFDAVMAGKKDPAETNTDTVLYQFETFGLLLQLNHETLP